MERLIELAVNMVLEEVRNIKSLEDKMTYLTKQLECLNCIEADVQTKLEVEESDRGKKRKREVVGWLNSVGEKRRECQILGHEVQQSRAYEVIYRWDLERQVVRKVQEVKQLVEQSRYFQGLVLDTLEPEKLPLVTSRGRGHAFEHNMGEIITCVMDDNISSTGIHGMGGVGKTTLAMHVHDKLLRESRFGGRVYWITVSQDFTIYGLQKDIAKAAGIDLSDEEDEKKRAGIIRLHLKKKLNFALILDDVWKGFDVEDIGVPLEGRKLLVTSREGQVCREIGCNKVIKVEVLLEKEAWELFLEKLKLSPTSHLDLGPEATQIAREVAKECAGLPLGIITIASSMRGVTDIHEWRYELGELKESFTKHENMKDKVLPILMYSYNRLRNSILQSCFLYCSLYPEDYEIRKCDLVRSFVYEEIMDQKSSRRLEFDQGYAMLSKLESACLLVSCKDGDGDECVKMHDLIRDMALWVTREKEPRFMVKAGHQLKEVPPVDKWADDLNRVSLMNNLISMIPDGISPMCPTLSSLYLNRNPLTFIPDPFFANMKILQTLDLSATDIVTLPDSVSHVVTLKALLLRKCKRLVSLPSLENLKALVELDLSYTKIVALPDSVSFLVTLKALLLRNCKKLVSLPSLENLKALVELDLFDTSIEEVIHGLENLSNLKRMEFKHVVRYITPPLSLRGLTSLQRLILSENKLVEVKEVKSLRNLEELQCRFANMDEFKQFIVCMNSERQLHFCHVLVGEPVYYCVKDKYDIGVGDIVVEIISTNTGEIAIDDKMIFPLRDIDTLKISDVEDIKCLLRESREVMDWSPLERLKYLFLEDLPELENIVEWAPPPAATFSSLIILDIRGCDGMKKLLPGCLVDNLSNLEKLEVRECLGMEEIIGEAEENNSIITMPKLKELKLWGLPELKSICKSTLICNSIEKIIIGDCTKLKKIELSSPLLNGQQSPPSALERIYLSKSEREWWDSLEWNHPDHKHILHPFLYFF